MMKYHNLHLQAKKYIQEGAIGQVNDIRVQFSCWYPEIEGAWRQKRALGGGGVVMDIGVHGIELIEFLLDEEITDVRGFCATRTFGYEVEDSGVTIFRTQSGVLGLMDVNFNIPDNASESKLEIYGSKGYIVCKGTLGQEERGTLCYLYAPQGDYSASQSRAELAEPITLTGGGEDLYLKQMLDFRACVEKNAPDYFYAERAVQVQKIIDEIYAKA
jgi:predicted dehydrogenase